MQQQFSKDFIHDSFTGNFLSNCFQKKIFSICNNQLCWKLYLSLRKVWVPSSTQHPDQVLNFLNDKTTKLKLSETLLCCQDFENVSQKFVSLVWNNQQDKYCVLWTSERCDLSVIIQLKLITKSFWTLGSEGGNSAWNS